MASFISFVRGGASGGSVVIDEACDLVVVGVSRGDSNGAGATATLGGATMSVASNGNDWAQLYYILAPSSGSQTIVISPSTNISSVYAAQYGGIGEFASGSQSAAASQTLSLSRGGVLAFAMSAGSTSHTPLTDTNEHYDSGGDYFGDRLDASGGSLAVGVASATDPDSCAGAWLDESSGAALTATAAFASGSATAAATVSRVREANASFAGGEALLSVTASRGRELTASFSSGQAAMAVSATRARDATATFAAGDATFAATLDASGNKTATAAFAAGAAALSASAAVTSDLEASASFQAQGAAMSASASRGRTAAPSFSAGSATLAASATVAGNRTATAAFTAGSAAFSATLSSPITIVRPGASVAAHVAGAGVSVGSALSSVSAAEATSKVIVSRAT